MPEMPRRTTAVRSARAVVLAALVAGLTACGSTTTSDTEGMTLADARTVLVDEGVAPANIAVEGETDADPAAATVCDHDPDGVDVASRTTLYVARDCEDAFAEGGALSAFVAAGKIKKHAVKKVSGAAARKVKDKAASSGTSGSSSSTKKAKKKK